MKVLVIEPHKKPYTQEVEHTLENLQRIVDGLIEPIYLDDVAIVVNEEGKINGLPFNRALRDENRRILDLLFGTFFICGLFADWVKKTSRTFPNRRFRNTQRCSPAMSILLRQNAESAYLPFRKTLRYRQDGQKGRI